MRKFFIALSIFSFQFSPWFLSLSKDNSVFAGGLVTNSNQSASFLRNPARDAVIDIDGVYTNPAGVCFMSKGFHLGLTIQHPEQERDVTTTFPMLAYNEKHLGETTRKYEGKASAPVVPSFQAAYVMDKWTFSASFAFSGGGGKCEFDNGIGSIESVLSLVPAAAALQSDFSKLGAYTYSMNSYMKGRQYYYGIQLGAGYKISDHVAVFAGLRAVIGNATYTGYVHDIKFTSIDQTATAPFTAAVIQGVNSKVSDIDMTTDQSCLGWTPIIGVDWKINEHWNLAAKYEFRTKMNLKNSSDMNAMARSISALDKFNDQKTEYVRDDIPGTLSVGVQYSPVNTWRFSGGFHFYDDCNAKKYNDEQKLVDSGTREFLLGAEWDITKLVTASIGWQNTHYSLSDKYMQDMSYNVSSNLLGLGVRLNVSEKVNIDLGYMHNFYEKRTVTDPNYTMEGIQTGLQKTDVYERSNDVVAVGVNLSL